MKSGKTPHSQKYQGEEKMEALFGIAILPLICLGVMILTAVVVIFTLQRGTRAISKQLKEQENTLAEPGSGNTRWARGEHLLRVLPESAVIKRFAAMAS